MANVVSNDDERSARVCLSFSEPADTTGPTKDQTHQIPAHIAEGAVSGFFFDWHLTLQRDPDPGSDRAPCGEAKI